MADTEYPSNVSELRYPGGGELARIKMQPHSVEAEQSVLGGLLLSADGWDAVAELVTAGDFYRPGHRLIFRQIAQLAEATVAVAKGNFKKVIPDQGKKDELGMLVNSFNSMTAQLNTATLSSEKNRIKVEEARKFLDSILTNLLFYIF